MFIPRFWSEASHLERMPGRQVTVRRFGWASTSQQDADAHARQRVEEALAVLREGGPEALAGFTRRERKVAYAGSDGLPIREEIVREWEDAEVVVTRNSYGALCLNTTRAMFVDVDRAESRAGLMGCAGILLGAVLGVVLGPLLLHAPWAAALAVGAVAGLLVGVAAGRVLHRMSPQARDPVGWSIGRCRDWCATHPEWRVVAYETPHGARLLPVHAPFDAGEPSSFLFMAHVGADPLYQRMCRLQKCFRARVSPKPWRAGMPDHFRAGGTWPVRDPDKLARRAEWVRRYEQCAGGYASCRYVETVGDGQPHAGVEAVRRLHDEMCRAGTGLQLA